MTSSRGKPPMAAWRVLPLVAALVLGHAAAQHSEPLVHDSQATKGGNKFKTRNVEDIEKHIFGTHANEFDPTTACPHRHVPLRHVQESGDLHDIMRVMWSGGAARKAWTALSEKD
jgi:hypothetical protein